MPKFLTNVIVWFTIGIGTVLLIAYCANSIRPPSSPSKAATDVLLAEIYPSPAVDARFPFVGMTYTAFAAMCNDRLDVSLKDRSRIYDDGTQSAVLYREYTRGRGQTLCYGTFTIDNGFVSTIAR